MVSKTGQVVKVIVFAVFLATGESDLVIERTYLRDMEAFPLPSSGEAYTSPQPGKCNHFNTRKGGVPAMIVQHHTVGDYNRTIKIFTSMEQYAGEYLPGVSSHFVIAKNGTVQQMVPLEYRAFHAGAGRLSLDSRLVYTAARNLRNLNITFNYDILHKGRGDMNGWSIGIENVNTGDEPFTKEQIKSNIFLMEALCDAFPSLDPTLVLSHSDWTYRKIDPSPFFPWKELGNAAELFPGQIKRNFGTYPRSTVLKENPEVLISHNDEENSKLSSEFITDIQVLLRGYGYYISEEEMGKVGKDTKSAIFAAHIHFQGPKIITDPILAEAWHNLAHNINYNKNYDALTVFDENLYKMLWDLY